MPNESDALTSLARSMDLLLRLEVQNLKGKRNNTEMILLLDSLGFRPAEIATVLGTTSTTVRPILSKSRLKKNRSRSR